MRFKLAESVMVFIVVSLFVFSSSTLAAANYSVDFVAGSPGSQALFMDSAERIPVPVGTVIWFVAGDVPTGKVSITVVHAWRIITTLISPGNYPAVVGQGVSAMVLTNLAPEVASQPVSVILWNDANHNGIMGDSGDTFGVYRLPPIPMPPFGNATWAVGHLHADENLVTGPGVNLTRVAGGVSISFTGTLQAADSLTGPWVDMVGGVSPLLVKPAIGQKFYRARQ